MAKKKILHTDFSVLDIGGLQAIEDHKGHTAIFNDEDGRYDLLTPEAFMKAYPKYVVRVLGKPAFDWDELSGWHDFQSSLAVYPLTNGSTVVRFHHGYYCVDRTYERAREAVKDILRLKRKPIVLGCHQDHMPKDLRKYTLFPRKDGYGRLIAVRRFGEIELWYSYGGR